MEFFPSDGHTSWALIESAMARADFFVLVTGDQYGSVDSETGLSWTRREFRAMLAARGPIVALLKSPIRTSDVELKEFREEIEGTGFACQYWRDEADLAQKLAASVGSLIDEPSMHGWRRVGDSSSEPRPPDWENSLYRTSWHFSTSRVPELGDATQLQRRTIRALRPSGIQSIELSQSRRRTGYRLPYDIDGGPKRELLSAIRSTGVGRVSLGPPVYDRLSYRQKVILDPPAYPGETLDYEVKTFLPRSRFLVLDDLRAASAELGDERDYDHVAATISKPTDLFELEVTFAPEIAAFPRGAEALTGEERDAAESIRATHGFTWSTRSDGCSVGLLRVLRPARGLKYRVSWYLPERR